MEITKAYFFKELFGGYTDFISEEHLECSNRFLCMELSGGEKVLVVGSSDFAIHDMLCQAIRKTDIFCQKIKIIGAGAIRNKKIFRWDSTTVPIETPDGIRKQISEFLGAEDVCKKRVIGYTQGDCFFGKHNVSTKR